MRAIAIISGVALLSGCSSESSGDARAGAGLGGAAVPVTVAAVVTRDVPVQIRAIGNVEPYSTVSIKAQVEGQLAQVHFREGQRVTKGELLFTIDARPFEAALRQAEANLARDVAEAKNAEVDATRRTRLLPQGFVSRDEYDQAQTRAVSLQAAVKADQAAVEAAKLSLQYCFIHSPLDGRVGQILVHEGNVVKANETTLAVINQIQPTYVTFSVPEQRLAEVRERAAAATLKVSASPNGDKTSVVGTLSFINNTVDPTTGTVVLKAVFTNEDEVLWPGQFVDVALTLSVHSNAVVVPAQAVQTGQQGQYVFLVAADQTVETHPVVVGDAAGQDVVVEGLTPGERVVTDGQVRLAAGVKVEIKNDDSSESRSARAATAD